MAQAPSRAEVAAANAAQATAAPTVAAPDVSRVFAFRADSDLFVFDMDESVHSHELDLFNEAGLTLAKIGELMEQGQIPMFVVAAIGFLARRQAGDQRVKYRQILAQLEDADDVEPLSDAETVEALAVSRLNPPRAGR